MSNRKKLNILINAYAVSPNWGSEPGMGWNWIINIAKHCNVFVITEGEWKEEILDAVRNLPQKDNIRFYFNPMSDKVRKMCWNQGDWRFYWYYARWQKKTLEIALQIIAENHIDVMHQLNMIGFREPGYLWKIKDIPLVWGPVGGIANIPTSYLSSAGWKMNLFCRLKNLISDMQFRFHPRVRAAIKRSTMIAAMKEVQTATQKVYGKDIPVINETGTYPSRFQPTGKESQRLKKEFNILWVGKFDFRKQFLLALKSVARLSNKPEVELHVVAPMTGKQEELARKQIESLHMSEYVKLYGRIPNEDVQSLMSNSDVLLFTSLSEGTPHVVLEAIKNNLPIICFDICGHGEIVDDSIGIKIPLSNPEESSRQFADAMEKLRYDQSLKDTYPDNFEVKQQKCSWEKKIEQIIKIYSDLVCKNDQ